MNNYEAQSSEVLVEHNAKDLDELTVREKLYMASSADHRIQITTLLKNLTYLQY